MNIDPRYLGKERVDQGVYLEVLSILDGFLQWVWYRRRVSQAVYDIWNLGNYRLHMGQILISEDLVPLPRSRSAAGHHTDNNIALLGEVNGIRYGMEKLGGQKLVKGELRASWIN